MPQLSAFGKATKKALIDKGWTLERLAAEVTKHSGLFCDTAYICKVFYGKRKAPNIVKAIKEILELE